jgi:Putative secretion activating protein
MSQAKAKAFIRGEEGGAYHPTRKSYDPNPTKWGITQTTYNAYGYPGSVFDMTEDQWDAIFDKGFWRKAGCQLWPEPLDIVIADPAFNAGPKQALRFLQRAVQATPDGVFGPQTIAMVQAASAKPDGVTNLCIRVQGQRIRFYKDLYAKSVQAQKDWDAAETKEGDRPALAPISVWLGRTDRLGKAIGLH